MALRTFQRLAALILASLLGVTCAAAQLLDPRSAPEAATGSQSHELVRAKQHMVSAANELAAEAGREMLRAGGSAVDAAIAVQLVLNIVEPQSSGIGGGAFILYWDNAKAQLTAFDGRETAPASARPERFLVDGKPMAFGKAVLSGLSIGVPGVVRLLEDVHGKYGKLPWAKLFEPAIGLAENGFAVSPRLHLLLRLEDPEDFVPAARRYFFTGTGSALPMGYQLKNPQLAATLRAIAQGGSAAFYDGPIAQAIVDAVNAAPTAPGGMTLDDLKNYKAKERATPCVIYRAYEVCGVGAPSSGGAAVAQTLKLLEGFDLGKGRDWALNAAAVHLIAEAEKLAFADRNRYIGDPDFVTVPDGLLDDAYIAQRRALISLDAVADKPKAGSPPGLRRQSFGVDATVERAGDQPYLDHRWRRQRAGDDDDHRGGVRIAQLGGRVPAQQRADGLFLRAGRCRWSAGGQRGRPGKAAALVDGADHRLRQGATCCGGARLARRQPHHPLRAEDPRCPHRLGARCARGGRPHELRQPGKRAGAGAGLGRRAPGADVEAPRP